MPHALLEIHSGMMSTIIADTIPCDRLRVEVELETDLQLGEPPESTLLSLVPE
jgi:hypothetical protein